MDKSIFAVLLFLGAALSVAVWATVSRHSSRWRTLVTVGAVAGFAAILFALTNGRLEVVGLIVGASYAAAVRLFLASASWNVGFRRTHY